MKYPDEVRVNSDRYEAKGIKNGAVGTIIFSRLRDLKFEAVFSNCDGTDYADELIFVGDLELQKENELISDADILKDLPLHDPNWWCKVENGYILNLKGERKNKIPYDYDS